jgi:hypothetical protein
MRSETIEQRLVTGAMRPHRLVHGRNTAASSDDTLQDREAFDVAFENYTRVDVSIEPNLNLSARNSSDATKTTTAIFADSAAQLDALDRQRQRLSNLLRDASR